VLFRRLLFLRSLMGNPFANCSSCQGLHSACWPWLPCPCFTIDSLQSSLLFFFCAPEKKKTLEPSRMTPFLLIPPALPVPNNSLRVSFLFYESCLAFHFCYCASAKKLVLCFFWKYRPSFLFEPRAGCWHSFAFFGRLVSQIDRLSFRKPSGR